MRTNCKFFQKISNKGKVFAVFFIKNVRLKRQTERRYGDDLCIVSTVRNGDGGAWEQSLCVDKFGAFFLSRDNDGLGAET